MSDTLKQFCLQFQNLYPEVIPASELEAKIAPLVSTQIIKLPTKVLRDVEKAARDLFAASRTSEQIQNVRNFIEATETPLEAKKQLEVLDFDTKQLSILMAYDFHYDAASDLLSLIEINTNASGFLFADLMYRATELKWPHSSPSRLADPRASFIDSILKEWKAFGGKNDKPSTIAIIDESPDQQKMFVEFLMYDSLLKQNGFKSQIFDIPKFPALSGEFDFAYNRFNDFTFKEERSKHLRQAYFENKVCFSPQPKEYLLLAHKQRLVEFGEAKVSDTLIPILDMAKEDAEAIWAKRKNYFFKPKALYGSKAVYRGSSVSHKTYNSIDKKDYIAQEYRPPGMVGDFKYDLRFYAYGDEIHLGVARAYQGQVTNFSTPGGGFAPITFKD